MKNKHKYLDFLPWILLACSYAVCVFLNAKYGKQILDSDMASEMVLANLLNKENSIISNNWYYPSELRVIHMQLLFKVGLKLFPNNWHLVRVLSQSILMALYALSVIYCSYCAGFKNKGIYLAAIMIMPLGLWNTFHNYFGGFYLIFTIPTLLLTGIVFKYAYNNKTKLLNLIILFIIGVIVGMNGIKVILYFAIPSLFTSFILLFGLLISKKDSLSNFKETFEYRYLLVSIVNAFGLFVGYLIYKLLCNSINYVSFVTYTWQPLSFNTLFNNISSFLMNLGYPANDYFGMNINAMSTKGLLGVFGVFTVIIFIVSIVRLVQNYQKLNLLHKSLFLFSLLSICLSIFIMSCLYEETNGSYFLPIVPFAFLIIELEIENEELSHEWLRNAFRIVIVCFVAIASIPNVIWYINKHPRRDKDLNAVVSFLSENNIDYIYSEFWDGNVVTELTNGEINAYVIEDYKTLNKYNLLQTKDSFAVGSKPLYVLINGKLELNDMVYDKDGFEVIYSEEYSLVKAKDEQTYLKYIND